MIKTKQDMITAFADLVYLIAGDQHDESVIDEAFNLPGLGYRINMARKSIENALNDAQTEQI